VIQRRRLPREPWPVCDPLAFVDTSACLAQGDCDGMLVICPDYA